jgi:predicted RNA-binding protein YlxR (DUF448 family)
VEFWLKPDKNDRTCIVTRESGPAVDLIRFVAAPDGSVVPDLKRNLPGRGCWIKAERHIVDEAVKRKLLPRALKTQVSVPEDLGSLVDRLLTKSALGSLALARKSGAVVTGSAKVDSAIRQAALQWCFTRQQRLLMVSGNWIRRVMREKWQPEQI